MRRLMMRPVSSSISHCSVRRGWNRPRTVSPSSNPPPGRFHSDGNIPAVSSRFKSKISKSSHSSRKIMPRTRAVGRFRNPRLSIEFTLKKTCRRHSTPFFSKLHFDRLPSSCFPLLKLEKFTRFETEYIGDERKANRGVENGRIPAVLCRQKPDQHDEYQKTRP